MVENSVKQPLLQQGGDPPSSGHAKPKPPTGAGPRRFRRCRTAPSTDAAQDSPPRNQDEPSLQSGSAAGTQQAPPPPKPKELLRGARPSFRLVGVLLLAYLLAGTIAFYLAMDNMSGDRTGSRVVDALYFCVVTMTTVGYGDLVPASDAAKLLACAFVFAGVALVGTFLSKAADYLVEKQEALLFRALHLRRVDDRKALRAMEANKVRYKLYTAAALLAAMLASGTAFLVEVEGMRPVDAFYCVCHGDHARVRRPELLVRGRARVRGRLDHREHGGCGALLPVRGGAGRRAAPAGAGAVGAQAPNHLHGPRGGGHGQGPHGSVPRTSCCTSSRSWGRSASRRSRSSWRSSTSSTPTTPAPSRRTTSSWHSTVSAAITGSQQGRWTESASRGFSISQASQGSVGAGTGTR